MQTPDEVVEEGLTMADYISRKAALEAIKTAELGQEYEAVEAIPSADVVEVVRCGECKHWRRCLSDDGKIEYYNFSHCEKGHHGFPNFFCADGEMRNDG